MPRPQRRLPSHRAMITAPQPEAVEAGTFILKAGGSAMDAVMACAFTQGVVDPLMCGIGGLGSLQVFDPASGRHEVIDGLSWCNAGHDAWRSRWGLHRCCHPADAAQRAGLGHEYAGGRDRFSATSNVIDLSNRIPHATERALLAMGYQTRRSPMSYPFAAPHGITLWDGVLEGGADPQRDGLATGV